MPFLLSLSIFMLVIEKILITKMIINFKIFFYMEMFSFTFWMWVAFVVFLLCTSFQIKNAVNEKDYQILGGIFTCVICGSFAIYNTTWSQAWLSPHQLDNAIFSAIAITLGWCLISWIYCKIRY